MTPLILSLIVSALAAAVLWYAGPDVLFQLRAARRRITRAAGLEPDRGPSTQTLSGNPWYFEDPLPCDVRAEDFWALARVLRFGGHTLRPYSVAEHSLEVESLLRSWRRPAWERLRGLVHDLHEIVPPGDVQAPLLHAGSMFSRSARAMSRRAERAFMAAFGLPLPMPRSVKVADMIVLATEKRDIMAPAAVPWRRTLPGPIARPHRIKGLPLDLAAELWIERLVEVLVEVLAAKDTPAETRAAARRLLAQLPTNGARSRRPAELAAFPELVGVDHV